MRDFDVCQLNVRRNMNGMRFATNLLKLIHCFSMGGLPSGKAAMKKMWISACLTFLKM